MNIKISSVKHPEVHILSFAAGSIQYQQTLERLGLQCINSRLFTSVILHNLTTLKRDHPEFSLHLTKFAKKNPRGFGLWIWKPYLILHTLKSLPQGSILLYLDAGCSLNVSEDSLARWREYILMVQRSNLLAFQLRGSGYSERHWTRKDLVIRVGLRERDLSSNQIEPGVCFFLVNDYSIQFVQKWFELCKERKSQFLKLPRKSNRYPEYIEHRFDQSVFSALYKVSEIECLESETWFYPNWEEDGKCFPIWAKRDRPPAEISFIKASINKLMLFQHEIRKKFHWD